MLISSFYGDAFAGQFALRLKGSAKHFDIDCDLFKWEHGASEADRSRLRSVLLARNLLEHPQDDVLFVEPDACFQRRPDILLDEKDYDVGVYYDLRTLEVSGPIFLRNNNASRRLLRAWQALSKSQPEATEYETLSRILSSPGFPLEVRRLPVTYAWVERLHRDVHPASNPVIVHFKTDGLLSSRIRIAR
ncbi:MAG: hypothetical protein EHM91_05930 [Planctomycetota bacterium]|nr:MAG: hypothetical protein EHM91_05930 [Planctomycetota bacterium]